MHYDDFTAHHDYELWLGNLLPELEANGLQGRRLLDVGCGTGKSFLPMLDRGWDVVAVDISPSMAAIAAEKAGGRARVEVADMRALPMLGDFDLVWCLDDAINYLLSAAELRRCLAGLRRNLRPGGLCLFDVNCLSAYRGFFSETARGPGRRPRARSGAGGAEATPSRGPSPRPAWRSCPPARSSAARSIASAISARGRSRQGSPQRAWSCSPPTGTAPTPS